MYPTYVQRQLNPLAPPDIQTGSCDTVRFVISLAAARGKVSLDFEQVGSDGKDYIAITQDCMVEIVLEGGQLYFSKDLDAITTKEELSSFYGGIVYDGYNKDLDRYSIVRFSARYNRDGKLGTVHGFNVNVDFLQHLGRRAHKWIAITIDPDIKNPPPDKD